MESGLIHPLDWVAAACVAFGLCAGIARGFWHQFSRFLVWAGAILVGAFLRPILAHFFTGLDSEIPALRAEWGLCLLALPGFYLLRRWVFSWWESIAPGTPSRIAGGFFWVNYRLIGFTCLDTVADLVWPPPQRKGLGANS